MSRQNAYALIRPHEESQSPDLHVSFLRSFVDSPESPDSRDAWRDALAQYLARKERIRTLRVELAAVRLVAKERRHEQRLARNLKKEPSEVVTGHGVTT